MAAARLRADLFTLPSGKPLPMGRADAVAAIERAKGGSSGLSGSSGSSKESKEEDEARTRSAARATARKVSGWGVY